MSKFSREASIQSDLPRLPFWPGDSRYATDSPTLTVHHQNLQVSCKFIKNFLLKQHQFPLSLELRSILLQIGYVLNVGNAFSANLRTLIFKIFWESMPQAPQQGVKKIFLTPAHEKIFRAITSRF